MYINAQCIFFQPKYIGQLLKASERRKIEDERRAERKVQKEREQEGDEFADKEVFVTSAYKKKMQERQEQEERERREAELEGIVNIHCSSILKLTFFDSWEVCEKLNLSITGALILRKRFKGKKQKQHKY